MIIELTTGAEASGKGFHDFKNLELEFLGSLGFLQPVMVLPSDDADVFMMFLGWLVTEKRRSLSLDTIWRAAGSVMARTRRTNLTKDPACKAFYEELRVSHGVESRPRTAATRRMIVAIFDHILRDCVTSDDVLVRTELMMAVEMLLGLRVGEVCGGGDGHGLLANNLVILRNIRSGEESVEGFLEHSKTKHRRFVNAVMESRGAARIRLGEYLRAYWSAVGFPMSPPTRADGGCYVEGPDYYVVRLSLVALAESAEADRERLEHACRVLKRSRSEEARRWADYSLMRGRQRLVGGSADRRYINVVGGSRTCDDIAWVADELTRAGFGDWIDVVPGPLMRATHGRRLGYTHMPLDPGSTYQILGDLMVRAYREANAITSDPELDLQGFDHPLWGHHSFRRFADTVARETMASSGATEQDIDIYFGWMERFYSQKMQVHYQSRFDRTRRTAVTSLA